MKLKIIALMVFVLLGAAVYKLGKAYKQALEETRQLAENMATMQDGLNYYQSKNGDLVAQNKVLVFRNKRFKKAMPLLYQEIKDLRVKAKRVEAVSQTVIENEKQIQTIIRDSIIHDTIKARVFHYKDDYYTVYGIAVNDTQKVNIQSRDSLIQVVYRGKRKRPYLWILSRRQLEQVISSKNPHSTITYARHIKITKRKK